MVLLSDYKKLEDVVEKAGIDACYFMLECKQKDRAVLELEKQIAQRK